MLKFENNIEGRARLWDTASKFLSPVPRVTSPDHLVGFNVAVNSFNVGIWEFQLSERLGRTATCIPFSSPYCNCMLSDSRSFKFDDIFDLINTSFQQNKHSMFTYQQPRPATRCSNETQHSWTHVRQNGKLLTGFIHSPFKDKNIKKKNPPGHPSHM